MLLKKEQKPILYVNAVFLIIFSITFLKQRNYEFVYYIGVIIFFLLLIVFTNNKVKYPNDVLWGLSLWSVLHMSGGGIIVNGEVLYRYIILDIVGEPYHIFKFDQFVHIVGFAVATLVAFHLIRKNLKAIFGWVSVSIVVVMAGLGLGALNEIVEFMATVFLSETGVGGYINTSLDLVADLIGAVIAMIFVIAKEKK